MDRGRRRRGEVLDFDLLIAERQAVRRQAAPTLARAAHLKTRDHDVLELYPQIDLSAGLRPFDDSTGNAFYRRERERESRRRGIECLHDLERRGQVSGPRGTGR